MNYKRIWAIFVLLVISLSGCKNNIKVKINNDTTGNNGNSDTPTQVQTNIDISVDSISIYNQTTSSFTVRVNFSRDKNTNATAIVYYCNETQSPGCDPKLGSSVNFSRTNDDFETVVSGLTSPNEKYNIYTQVIDTDGVSTYPKTAQTISAKRIYRSMGITATALQSGSGNPMSINNSIATFDGAINDNIGLGDAIEFDLNGDSVIDVSDEIVFISYRFSNKKYLVKKADGSDASDVNLDEDWKIFRAYQNLSDAESLTENSSIDADLRNFDVDASGRDIATNNEIWNIVGYADGLDASGVHVLGWTTAKNNYLKIMTPVTKYEVGTSQRHTGVWGTGYRRSSYLYIHDNFVRLDGIAVWQQANAKNIHWRNVSGAAEAYISNCWARSTGDWDVYDFFQTDSITVYMWNNVGISDSADPGADVFWFNDSDITLYAYNNTGISNGGHAFYARPGVNMVSKNNIGMSYGTGQAFYGYFDTVDYCAANDGSLSSFGGTNNLENLTFNFIDGVDGGDGYNLHISSSDTVTTNKGVDLSADPNLSFTTDFDNQIRTGLWDIGFDQN